MRDVNPQDALQELVDNIRAQDEIKARLVLDDLRHLDEQGQKRLLYELNRCNTPIAIPLLVYLAVRHADIIDRFPALSESILAKVQNDPQLLLGQLVRSSPEQWYYIRLAGTLRLQAAVAPLIKILAASTDLTVLQESVSALASLGDPAAVDAIGELLSADREELIAPAVRALGRLAAPSAIPRLAGCLGRNAELDTLILETLAAIQDETAIRKLNEIMLSRSARLRNCCKGLLIALGEKSVRVLVENLVHSDPDLCIHSLNALQAIGDPSARLAVRKLIATQPANANVRFAAFEAIASLPGPKGDYILTSGLTDPDSNVRLAAARAIDANFDEVLGAGIRNMTQSADRDAAAIIRAILDSQAATITLDLIRHQAATETMIDYLALHAHPDIKNFFLQLMINHDAVALAEAVMARSEQAEPPRPKEEVCAVDDSRMVLSIYRSVLNELGFTPVLFQFPAEALAWLTENTPKFVCTDLNMPVITGIELTRKIRERHARDTLPVILVTTQDDKQDHDAACQAGVNAIIGKPFDAEKFRAVIAKLL